MKVRWSLNIPGLALASIIWLIVTAPFASAFQDAPAQPAAAQEASPLADEQTGLAKQFGDLENLLLKLSEIEADSNPVRASILQRASKLGKESSLQSRLKEAAKSLENKQFSRAIEEQEATKAGLEQLLTLLLSEDRDDRVREEKKKIEEMIKEIQRLNRLQKSLRQRTESAEDPQELSEDQNGLAEKAGELAEDLSAGDEKNPDAKETSDENKPADDKESNSTEPNIKEGSSESKPNDNPQPETNKEGDTKPEEKPDDNKSPSNGEPQDGDNKAGDKPAEKGPDKEPNSKDPNADKPNESPKPENTDPNKPSDMPPNQEDSENSKAPESEPADSKPSETPSGEQSPPKESEPSPSESTESPSGEPSSSDEPQPPNSDQPPQPQTPQKRVEQARKKMEDAKKKLENAEKEKAIEAQKEAEDELRKAVDELEQILRQLREEEVERTLVQLETRFRRMLEMQLEVNEETKKLDRIAADQRERAWEQRAVGLSQGERKIVDEAQRALLLLREEGTSLAFPEAGEQLLADMQTVATRLDGSDVGALTQTIESEIVTGLEEILEALSTAQKENEKKKSQDGSPPQPPQPGEPQQQPLVDKLAELRLIRTLQMRINTRTIKLAELMGTKEDAIGLSDQGEMRQQIRELGGRQQRLQQITRDIVVGRGQ